MNIFIRLLISTLVILGAAYVFPGISVSGFWVALITAFILALINLIIRPVLVFLTLPITIITLGLFLFVINAALVMLTDFLIPGFRVDNFWWALLLSLILSIVNITTKDHDRKRD